MDGWGDVRQSNRWTERTGGDGLGQSNRWTERTGGDGLGQSNRWTERTGGVMKDRVTGGQGETE